MSPANDGRKQMTRLAGLENGAPIAFLGMLRRPGSFAEDAAFGRGY